MPLHLTDNLANLSNAPAARTALGLDPLFDATVTLGTDQTITGTKTVGALTFANGDEAAPATLYPAQNTEGISLDNLYLPLGTGTLALTQQPDGRVHLGNLDGILPIASGGTGGNTAGAARTALGSKNVGDAIFTAETQNQAKGFLGLGPIPVNNPTVFPTGFTLNASGNIDINQTGFAAIGFPVTGLVAGGIYVASFVYLTVTSGSIQQPSLNTGGDPGPTSSPIGASTAAIGSPRSSITIWSTPTPQNLMANQLVVRLNNGFVGTISRPTLVRIG